MSHEAIERLIECIGDSCFIVNSSDLRILAANTAAESLYGADKSQFTGTTVPDWCAEGAADAVVAEIASCNGSTHSFTADQRRYDGRLFGGEFTVSDCSDLSAGSVTVIVREQRPPAVDDGRLLRDLLLEQALDGVVAHTVDGQLLYANAAALESWGRSLEEIRARGPFGWTPEAQRQKIASRMELLQRDGEGRFESVDTSGGKETHSEIHARLVDTEDGTIVVSTSRDVSERIQTEEMVRYLAYHDTLTGLGNRVKLDQQLTHEISMADRHGDVLGLIFVDLDKFKPINDTYGHTIGDHALREVANRLSGSVREHDLVARLGGDEFVVVLPRLKSACDLAVIADKLGEEISEPMEIGRITIRVSATLGIAVHQRGEDAESFMIRADLAMYEQRDQEILDCELDTA